MQEVYMFKNTNIFYTLFYVVMGYFVKDADKRCKIGLHLFDSNAISTSYNGNVDYYCGNCENKIFTNHIENSDGVRNDYERLLEVRE